MPPEDILRRRDRLIVAEFTRDLLTLATERFRGNIPAAEFIEYFWVGRLVWIATMRGECIHAQDIAKQLGMRRNKVVRKLNYLVAKRWLAKEGHCYVVADAALTELGNLDATIALILETADQLRGGVSKTDTELLLWLNRQGSTPRGIHLPPRKSH